MEFQDHQLGVLPANDSALNSSSSGTPFEGSSSQQRGVLQGRSANWPHDNIASPITSTQSTSRKVSQIQSPIENAYLQQPTVVDNCFTSDLRTQHIGVPWYGAERPEKRISRETTRLYKLLQRSDKYQKYREKQPVLDRQQLIEKEAKEAMMVEKGLEKAAMQPTEVPPNFITRVREAGSFIVPRFYSGSMHWLFGYKIAGKSLNEFPAFPLAVPHSK